jgi:hypothetical protein
MLSALRFAASFPLLKALFGLGASFDEGKMGALFALMKALFGKADDGGGE